MLFRLRIALEIIKGCNIVVCDNKKNIDYDLLEKVNSLCY